MLAKLRASVVHLGRYPLPLGQERSHEEIETCKAMKIWGSIHALASKDNRKDLAPRVQRVSNSNRKIIVTCSNSSKSVDMVLLKHALTVVLKWTQWTND